MPRERYLVVEPDDDEDDEDEEEPASEEAPHPLLYAARGLFFLITGR